MGGSSGSVNEILPLVQWYLLLAIGAPAEHLALCSTLIALPAEVGQQGDVCLSHESKLLALEAQPEDRRRRRWRECITMPGVVWKFRAADDDSSTAVVSFEEPDTAGCSIMTPRSSPEPSSRPGSHDVAEEDGESLLESDAESSGDTLDSQGFPAHLPYEDKRQLRIARNRERLEFFCPSVKAANHENEKPARRVARPRKDPSAPPRQPTRRCSRLIAMAPKKGRATSNNDNQVFLLYNVLLVKLL